MFGILNINKPQGMTSRDVVNRISRIVGRKIKCGHAGTLDPLATGVLLVCVGKATKLVPYIHEHPKSYAGTFLFGKISNTDDIEGELESVDVPDDLSEENLLAHLSEFTGQITQVPPAHSAIWINGERAYKLARRGEEVDIPEREVKIDSLELTSFSPESFSLEMTCGTGTYVRSIGRDLARKVGTEAVMSELTRTSIGPFALRNAIELDELNRDKVEEHLENPLAILERFQQYPVKQTEERTLRYGQRIEFKPIIENEMSEGQTVILTDGKERLIAIAKKQGQELAPHLVFPET